MTHDPMCQADLERRLAHMAKARRCGAKTRAGHPCRQAAVRGRGRCRMHGGAKGSGGPRGKRNGNFRHGLCTREAKAILANMRATFREIKALNEFGRSGRGRRSKPRPAARVPGRAPASLRQERHVSRGPILMKNRRSPPCGATGTIGTPHFAAFHNFAFSRGQKFRLGCRGIWTGAQ